MTDNVVPIRKSKEAVRQCRRREGQKKAGNIITIWEWHTTYGGYYLLSDFKDQVDAIYERNPDAGRLAWVGAMFEEHPVDGKWTEYEIEEEVRKYRDMLRAANESVEAFGVQPERRYSRE